MMPTACRYRNSYILQAVNRLSTLERSCVSWLYILRKINWASRSDKKWGNEGKIYWRALERWIKEKEFWKYVLFILAQLIFLKIYRQLTQLLSNVDNLFTAWSSCCDIVKQLASFKGIKFTKQELGSESVSQLVTSIANDRTRVR